MVRQHYGFLFKDADGEKVSEIECSGFLQYSQMLTAWQETGEHVLFPDEATAMTPQRWESIERRQPKSLISGQFKSNK